MTDRHNSDGRAPDVGDLALRMQYLIATARKPDGAHYTVDEIARSTGISLTYLRNMLAGRQDNPSRKVISALSSFFQVSPAYFFDVPDQDASERSEPSSETEVALRSAERLSPEGRKIFLDMIRLAQRLADEQGEAK